MDDTMSNNELGELREVLTKLRIDVGILGAKIDQVQNLGQRVDEVRDKANVAAKDAAAAHKRLDAMEENNRWVKRTIGGAIISSIFSIAVAVIMVVVNIK